MWLLNFLKRKDKRMKKKKVSGIGGRGTFGLIKPIQKAHSKAKGYCRKDEKKEWSKNLDHSFIFACG